MNDAGWRGQSAYGIRFDWGAAGAAALGAEALVVVDVLSFSTAVCVAADRGTAVYPFRWRDDRAAAFAAAHDAVLATGRGAATAAHPWTLSPAALRAAPAVPRLVLPSPNGSTIAAATPAPRVVAGCLRNARAVAAHLAADGLGTPDRPVAVTAAGERHPDGSLRPALEDLLGAGAIIAALLATGDGAVPSPEAEAAAACAAGTRDVPAAVAGCASGRELVGRGFPQDVEIAAEPDTSRGVPILADGAFRRAPVRPGAARPCRGTTGG